MQAHTGANQSKPDLQILQLRHRLRAEQLPHGIRRVARMDEEAWQVSDGVILSELSLRPITSGHGADLDGDAAHNADLLQLRNRFLWDHVLVHIVQALGDIAPDFHKSKVQYGYLIRGR